MALSSVVPRVARTHFVQSRDTYHTVVTGLNEAGGLNREFKAIEDAADLAAAIAFILSILAPVGESGAVLSKAPVGNLHTLANYILATYPSGAIPALPDEGV